MKQKGFTLIELLVVISVIGLLASVILISLNSARLKAREAHRRATMRQMQTALSLYFDNNNDYPSTNGNWWGESATYGGKTRSGAGGYIPDLAPQYIAQLPRDPLTGATNTQFDSGCLADQTGYIYKSDGVNYKILAHCVNETLPDSSDPFYDPYRPYWALMVCSGEPACSTW